tara:strand:+ start:1395 stop:2909 length:1515 start_codon:yes stop_codon:yes gene_type:complete
MGMEWLTGPIQAGLGALSSRYTDGNKTNWGNVGKDALIATAAYAALNPNDSETIGNFMGTNQQGPVGYMGGIPNYTATRELLPNAFAQTNTDPITQKITPRRPGSAGRQYFTDTTYAADVTEPIMGKTAVEIAADNQQALDNQALYEALMGEAFDTRVADEALVGGASLGTVGNTVDGTGAADTMEAVLLGMGWTANADGTFTDLGGVVYNKNAQGGYSPATDTATDIINTPPTPPPPPTPVLPPTPTPTPIPIPTPPIDPPFVTDSSGDVLNFVDGNMTVVPQAKTEQQIIEESIAANYRAVDKTDGYSDTETDAVAAALAAGQVNIADISKNFGESQLDVITGLLVGGYQTPAQIAATLDAVDPVTKFTEKDLILHLLNEGKTNFADVAAYYQDQYPGITAAGVKDIFNSSRFAQGGNVNGYYLGGTTDGMADQIPATIDNSQPAALSDGEFVIPADIVSHLGNGNSEAGADNLYDMMERVRIDRTGNPNQGRQIDPNKYLA